MKFNRIIKLISYRWQNSKYSGKTIHLPYSQIRDSMDYDAKENRDYDSDETTLTL